MRVRVLGPVEVLGDDGRPCPLAPKARQLLALLAIHAPRAVAVDELAELLWDDPPPAATKTIQAHVSRLRAAVATAATIERTGVGYAMRAVPGACDVDVLAAHRHAARQWRDDGRLDEAAAALATARALWRGKVELPDSASAQGLVARWEREHRLLVDEHLAAIVDGAHPADAVSELHELTATDPVDERRWTLLVRALHRSGDVPGALRAYQAARAALAGAGLEPGAALRAEEAAALDDTPTSPVPTRAPGREAPVVRYADTGAGRVAYVVVGDGPVDMVVLNPGLISIDGIHQEPHLAGAIDRLARRGTVACLDRRGIGLSDPVQGANPLQPPSIDVWVADVVAVLDATGATPVVLGCSDTALVAIALAAAHPDRVRGLVLVHGYARYTRADGYPYGVDPETSVAASADVLDVDGGRRGFDPLSHIAPSMSNDPDFRIWFDAIGRRAASPAVAAAMHDAIRDADVRTLLAGVKAPVLLLHRRSCVSADVGHARYLQQHLGDAQLVMLPGADELWFVGDTDALDEAVSHWLTTRVTNPTPNVR